MKEMRSLKMTAALYATRREVVEHVRRHGRLPEAINSAGFPTAFGVILRRRGTDLVLTEKEKTVLDALIREDRRPGGRVRVIEEIGNST